MGAIVITNDNFEEEVLNAKESKVLVDFWASWCGPCKMLSPIIDEIASENHEGLKVCKVNVDENQSLAMKYQVMSIPTLLVFENGEVVKTSVGALQKDKVLELVK
ncbi:MAG: thioredoxin [Gallicola sp.]|uniref:thioredoxin n=1 Tax=Gallicola sp. Sow4_E12 TaxID=3438785 RepID=UPI0017D4378F|nr:thioredoxin [Gallicola sp.]